MSDTTETPPHRFLLPVHIRMLVDGLPVQVDGGMVGDQRHGIFLRDHVRAGWGYLMSTQADDTWVMLRVQPQDTVYLDLRHAAARAFTRRGIAIELNLNLERVWSEVQWTAPGHVGFAIGDHRRTRVCELYFDVTDETVKLEDGSREVDAVALQLAASTFQWTLYPPTLADTERSNVTPF